MPSPILIRTLRRSRTRWLSGDRQAFARYAACCIRVEAERRKLRDEKVQRTAAQPHRAD
ncbi:MAG: hypothetical protein R3362_10570 [Rhodothermales bacterium]|nr:hypothetical protein [Rhodothermales bacterium]